MILSFVQWIPTFTVLLQVRPCFAYALTAMQQLDSLVAVLETIPSCALGCVEAFTVSDYPNAACAGLLDLDCLCKTNTASGFTLGEAAYRCTVSHCSNEVITRSNAYGICNSVNGAFPMTHSIITATEYFTDSATTSATTAGIHGSGLTTTTSSIPTGSISRSTDTSVNGPSTLTSSGSSSSATLKTTTLSSVTGTTALSASGNQPTPPQSSASSTSPSSTPGAIHSLNSGAVAGISAASGISAFFLIGVAAFFCYGRRRKKNRSNKEQYFEIGGIMSEPPNFSRSPTRHYANSLGSSANTNDGNKRNPNPTSQSPSVSVTQPIVGRQGGLQNTDRIGFPTFSSSETEQSPMSMSSQRTASQLLPRKPIDALCPKPLRISRRENLKPASGDTLFEEEIQRRSRSFSGASHGLPGIENDGHGGGKYNPLPAVGLPVHPGVMRHGWVTASTPIVRSSNQQVMPSYLDSDGKSVWQAQKITGESNPKMLPLRPPLQNEKLGPGLGNGVGPKTGFKKIEVSQDHLSHQSTYGHAPTPPSKSLRPVREIAASLVKCRPVESSFPGAGPSSGQDAISQPRIVGKNEIKRVQIGRGRRRSRESINPNSPNDFWKLSRNDPTSQGIKFTGLTNHF